MGRQRSPRRWYVKRDSRSYTAIPPTKGSDLRPPHLNPPSPLPTHPDVEIAAELAQALDLAAASDGAEADAELETGAHPLQRATDQAAANGAIDSRIAAVVGGPMLGGQRGAAGQGTLAGVSASVAPSVGVGWGAGAATGAEMQWAGPAVAQFAEDAKGL